MQQYISWTSLSLWCTIPPTINPRSIFLGILANADRTNTNEEHNTGNIGIRNGRRIRDPDYRVIYWLGALFIIHSSADLLFPSVCEKLRAKTPHTHHPTTPGAQVALRSAGFTEKRARSVFLKFTFVYPRPGIRGWECDHLPVCSVRCTYVYRVSNRSWVVFV